MRAYSQDLRDRVFADRDAGEPAAAVARKYRVSPARVRRPMQRRRETGETTPRRKPPRPTKLSPHRDRLRALVEEKSDRTLFELRALPGVPRALSTIHNELRRLGLSYKKSP